MIRRTTGKVSRFAVPVLSGLNNCRQCLKCSPPRIAYLGMCNNNSSDYGHWRQLDKMAENGFQYENATAEPGTTAAGFCDNNNVTSNPNSQPKYNTLEMKRSSAPTHSRPKSMRKLLKSISLRVTDSGSESSPALHHQQSLGGKPTGFTCVCCDNSDSAQGKQKASERRYSFLKEIRNR